MFSSCAAACPSKDWSEKHLFNSSLIGLQDLAFGRAIITFWTGSADLPKASILIGMDVSHSVYLYVALVFLSNRT